jgi:hypothetical protein
VGVGGDALLLRRRLHLLNPHGRRRFLRALWFPPLSLPPQQGKRRAARGEVKPIGAGVECSADGEGLVEGGRDGPLLAGPNVIKPQLPAAWAQCNNAHLEGVRRIDIPFCDLFCQGPYQDFT